jgi:hypothetical protein
MAVVALGWTRLRYGARTADLLGWSRLEARHVGAGLLHGVVALIGINLALGALIQAAFEAAGREVPLVQPTFRLAADDPTLAPVLALSAVLVAPAAEELLFRGLLYQGLLGRVGHWPAAAISSAAWAAVHLQRGDAWASVVVGAGILPLGLYLCWVLRRRGTLLAPVVAHAVFNALGVVGLLMTR